MLVLKRFNFFRNSNMIKINLDDTLSTDVQPSDLARSVGGRARPPPGGPAVVPLQVFQEECRNIFDSIIY